MKNYTHLTSEERYYIYISLKSSKSLSYIADKICRSKSTVSREIKRNKGLKGYRHKQAHGKYQKRQAHKVSTRISKHIWEQVIYLIQKDLSPEQISGFLACEKIAKISHERIYQFILQDKKNGGILYKHLRCQRVKKRRYGKPDRRGQIKNRCSIDERPPIVDERARIGDWEADTVEGKKGGCMFVTLAERKSRLYLFGKVKNKSAAEVTKCIINMLKPLKDYVHTITFDNGKEFANHTEIAKVLGADTYFAHPYHSWERGLNENSNGLLRQYFPKGVSLDGVTHDDVVSSMWKLNTRPRKCLDYKTPYQAFLDDVNNVALST